MIGIKAKMKHLFQTNVHDVLKYFWDSKIFFLLICKNSNESVM